MKIKLLKDTKGNLWSYEGFDEELQLHEVVVVEENNRVYTCIGITCHMNQEELDECERIEVEDKRHLWVCDHCLAAIESREGYLPTLRHDIGLEYDDEDFKEMSKCDWCEENGFDVLYELI